MITTTDSMLVEEKNSEVKAVLDQWKDDNPIRFTKEDRLETTVLSTGVPDNTINMLRSALKPVGIRLRPLRTPTNTALAFGKEFGNRGQCNPTYFTVGSLIEHLVWLRDVKKIPKEDIIKRWAFMTVGGCGPCRMGMYATEYRKALHDSGFAGFRVILLSRSGQVSSAETSGFDLNKKELIRVFNSIIVSDVLNVINKRIRPYEVVPGSADAANRKCRTIMQKAVQQRKSILVAAWKCRQVIKSVKVDKLQVKPRILIQGEFWAKTTEGDGNYNLYRFLEKEGAEAVIETISDWLLHQLWRKKWETESRETMSFQDGGDGLKGQKPKKIKFGLKVADSAIRGIYNTLARTIGLKDAPLTDHDELGNMAHEYFDKHLDGGEDLMEVGHHMHTFSHNLANMVLSVKPFTCLSSNGVSDGIQPIISERFPNSIFVSVETNGDAPANFYSRIQMQLFKAKKAAQREVDDALAKVKKTMDQVRAYVDKNPKYSSPLHKSPHVYACPAANLILEVGSKV